GGPSTDPAVVDSASSARAKSKAAARRRAAAHRLRRRRVQQSKAGATGAGWRAASPATPPAWRPSPRAAAAPASAARSAAAWFVPQSPGRTSRAGSRYLDPSPACPRRPGSCCGCRNRRGRSFATHSQSRRPKKDIASPWCVRAEKAVSWVQTAAATLLALLALPTEALAVLAPPHRWKPPPPEAALSAGWSSAAAGHIPHARTARPPTADAARTAVAVRRMAGSTTRRARTPRWRRRAPRHAGAHPARRAAAAPAATPWPASTAARRLHGGPARDTAPPAQPSASRADGRPARRPARARTGRAGSIAPPTYPARDPHRVPRSGDSRTAGAGWR